MKDLIFESLFVIIFSMVGAIGLGYLFIFIGIMDEMNYYYISGVLYVILFNSGTYYQKILNKKRQ